MLETHKTPLSLHLIPPILVVDFSEPQSESDRLQCWAEVLQLLHEVAIRHGGHRLEERHGVLTVVVHGRGRRNEGAARAAEVDWSRPGELDFHAKNLPETGDIQPRPSRPSVLIARQKLAPEDPTSSQLVSSFGLRITAWCVTHPDWLSGVILEEGWKNNNCKPDG